MNTYHVGTEVRVTGTFKDADGAVANPTTISLVVRDPSGNEATYTYGGAGTITKGSTGIYHQGITTDEEGVWVYQWTGTGAVVTVDEGWFNVETGSI
jgi:hypothetical protein